MSSSSSGRMNGASGAGNHRSRMGGDGSLSNNAQISTLAPIPQQLGQQSQSSNSTTAFVPRWVIPQRRRNPQRLNSNSDTNASSRLGNNARNLDGFKDASVSIPSSRNLNRRRGRGKAPAAWGLSRDIDGVENPKKSIVELIFEKYPQRLRKREIPAAFGLSHDSPPTTEEDIPDDYIGPEDDYDVIYRLPKEFCRTNIYLKPLDILDLAEQQCKNCGSPHHKTSGCTNSCGKCGDIDHRHGGDTNAEGCCPNLQWVCGCELFPRHFQSDCQEECSYACCSFIINELHTIWQCSRRCFKCGSFQHLGKECPTTDGCPCGQGKHFGHKHGGGCMVTGCGEFFCTTHCNTCGLEKHLHPQGICTSTVSENWVMPIPCDEKAYPVMPQSQWHTLKCQERNYKYAFGYPDGCWLCVHEKTSQIKHMAIDGNGSNWKERLDTLLNTYSGGEWYVCVHPMARRQQRGGREAH